MSSRLLMDEPPLVVSPSLAAHFGINEAIVLQQIHYWIHSGKTRFVADGSKWVYNTYEEWQKQFPFIGVRTIQRIFLAFEQLGILLSRQEGMDRTKYYRIDYEKLESVLASRQPDAMENASDVAVQDDRLSPCIDSKTTTETTNREKKSPTDSVEETSTPSLALFPESQKQTPPPPSRGPADVIRDHLFPYYLSEAGRGDYGLTPLRLKKGVERLRECLKRTGDPRKAVELFEQAIDGLTGDPWNCGINPQKKKYLDWIDHLCVSPEMFDKRLEAGVAA